MNDENRLRGLLHDAVPEPPDSVATAAPVVEHARRGRRRRLVGSVVGAAAAVAAVASLTAVLSPDDVRPTPGPEVAAQDAPDPYGTDPCPDLTQPAPATPYRLPDDLRSVRLCPITPMSAVPQDALLTGLTRLSDQVTALPTSDPGRCAAVDVAAPTRALVATGRDGVQRAFAVGYCSVVPVDGTRSVDSDRVLTLVLKALGQQRSDLPAPTDPAVPATGRLCTVDPAAAPVDPARDELVAGAVCLMTTTGRRHSVRPFPLSASALATVQRSWTAAVKDDGPQCQALGARSLALVTAYGDVVHVTDNGCTLVTQNGAIGEPSYRLDLNRADLVRLPEKVGGDPALP